MPTDWQTRRTLTWDEVEKTPNTSDQLNGIFGSDTDQVKFR